MTTTPVTALVPYEVISQAVLQTNSSDVRFVFTFFDDVVLFPTENTSDTSAPSAIVASSVLSVSVIGATISNLNTPIRLNFTKLQVRTCIHTVLETHSGNMVVTVTVTYVTVLIIKSACFLSK